jgi:hypothetical protein
MPGLTHDALYTMPIYLRRFYMNKLVEVRKKEKDEIKKQTKKSNQAPSFKSRFNR